jgi:hypothetical protein
VIPFYWIVLRAFILWYTKREWNMVLVRNPNFLSLKLYITSVLIVNLTSSKIAPKCLKSTK